MMRLALAAIAGMLLAAPALAEEPKGFAGFPWGSTRERINTELLQPKCSGLTSPIGDPSPMCIRYELEGVGEVTLGLTFVGETLQGYSFAVPLAKMPDFTSAVEEKFGKGAIGDSNVSNWTWPSGTSATMIRRSPMGGMLVVRSKVSMDKSTKESDRIKKGF